MCQRPATCALTYHHRRAVRSHRPSSMILNCRPTSEIPSSHLVIGSMVDLMTNPTRVEGFSCGKTRSGPTSFEHHATPSRRRWLNMWHGLRSNRCDSSPRPSLLHGLDPCENLASRSKVSFTSLTVNGALDPRRSSDSATTFMMAEAQSTFSNHCLMGSLCFVGSVRR